VTRTPGSSNTARAMQSASATVALQAGDYVGLRVAQDSGAPLDLVRGALSIVRIGTTPS
jgi:hypothetical protein